MCFGTCFFFSSPRLFFFLSRIVSLTCLSHMSLILLCLWWFLSHFYTYYMCRIAVRTNSIWLGDAPMDSGFYYWVKPFLFVTAAANAANAVARFILRASVYGGPVRMKSLFGANDANSRRSLIVHGGQSVRQFISIERLPKIKKNNTTTTKERYTAPRSHSINLWGFVLCVFFSSLFFSFGSAFDQKPTHYLAQIREKNLNIMYMWIN